MLLRYLHWYLSNPVIVVCQLYTVDYDVLKHTSDLCSMESVGCWSTGYFLFVFARHTFSLSGSVVCQLYIDDYDILQHTSICVQ